MGSCYFFSLPLLGGIWPEGESLGISSPDDSRQSAPCLCQNVLKMSSDL